MTTELAKCEITDKAMNGHLDCTDKENGSKVIQAWITLLPFSLSVQSKCPFIALSVISHLANSVVMNLTTKACWDFITLIFAELV